MIELYLALKEQLRPFARSHFAETLTNHRTWSKTDLVEIANAAVAKEGGGHKRAVAGKLAGPFDAATVRRARPGWSEKSYGVSLSKHAVGNGANSELFVRLRPGYYRLKISN